jgi:SnoaL-like protein
MKKGTEMSEIEIGMEVLTMLSHLKNGKIGDAIARFAEEFRFKDHGIGLEFKDKDRLAEFFHKTRGLYPDSFLQTDTMFVSGDHVITEWTLQAMLTEPFYGGLARKVQVSLQGSPSCGQPTARLPTERTTTTDWPPGGQPWLRISRNGSNYERW